MAIWFLIKLIKSLRHQRKPIKFSVFGAVRNLREQRMGSVQTNRQYEYVYKMLKWYLDKVATNGYDKENHYKNKYTSINTTPRGIRF